MENLVLVIHVLAAVTVIGLVLLQHGKGADMGAAFGSGASGSLFGVSGSSNFLSRATAIAVTVFFITSTALGYFASHRANSGSVVKAVAQPVNVQQKAADSKVTAPAVVPKEGGSSQDVPK
ncbi:MAG TPA: preprotein translocase subunit SecG [Methylophilus sp.]|nr:preprotein translocase subunit SecG [Methylophilus sp.]HQQ33217.1 preprotein translocase subunit SecG [Methylophilus sp.]